MDKEYQDWYLAYQDILENGYEGRIKYLNLVTRIAQRYLSQLLMQKNTAQDIKITHMQDIVKSCLRWQIEAYENKQRDSKDRDVSTSGIRLYSDFTLLLAKKIGLKADFPNEDELEIAEELELEIEELIQARRSTIRKARQKTPQAQASTRKGVQIHNVELSKRLKRAGVLLG